MGCKALTALCREKSGWLTWKRGHLRTDQQMRMQLPVHEQTKPELLSDISPRDPGRGEGLWQRRRRLTSAASSSQHACMHAWIPGTNVSLMELMSSLQMNR